MKQCKCGCDEIVKERNIYINGHNRRGKNSYNMSGKNNPMYGKNHSIETKSKIRKARKGKKASEETKKKIGVGISNFYKDKASMAT